MTSRPSTDPSPVWLFHTYVEPGDDPSAWQHDLLDLTGCTDLPVRVVGVRHLRVERLVVPSRPVRTAAQSAVLAGQSGTAPVRARQDPPGAT